MHFTYVQALITWAFMSAEFLTVPFAMLDFSKRYARPFMLILVAIYIVLMILSGD